MNRIREGVLGLCLVLFLGLATSLAAALPSSLLHSSLQLVSVRTIAGHSVHNTSPPTPISSERRLVQLQLVFDQPLFLHSNSPSPRECPSAPGIVGPAIRVVDLQGLQRQNLPTLLALRCAASGNGEQHPEVVVVFGSDPDAEDVFVAAEDLEHLAIDAEPAHTADLDFAAGFRLDPRNASRRAWLRLDEAGEVDVWHFRQPDESFAQQDNQLSFVLELPPVVIGDASVLPSLFGPAGPPQSDSASVSSSSGCQLLWRVPATKGVCPRASSAARLQRRVWLGGPDRWLPRSATAWWPPASASTPTATSGSTAASPESPTPVEIPYARLPSVTEFLVDSLATPAKLSEIRQEASVDPGKEGKQREQLLDDDDGCAALRRQQEAVFVETHVQALGAVLGPVMDIALSPVMDQFTTSVTSRATAPLNEGLMASLSGASGQIAEKVVEGLSRHWPPRLADALTHRLGNRLAAKLSNLLFLKLQQPLAEALDKALRPWLEKQVPDLAEPVLQAELLRTLEKELEPALLGSLSRLVTHAVVPTLARALVQREDICDACAEWLGGQAGEAPQQPPQQPQQPNKAQQNSASEPIPINQETCRFCSLLRTPGFTAGKVSAHFSEYYGAYFGEYYRKALLDQLEQEQKAAASSSSSAPSASPPQQS